MEKNYTKSGGLIIGTVRMTYPLAKISVYENKLIIKYLFFFKLEFLKNEIISIIPSSNFSSRGIIINHKKESYNSKIIFMDFNPDKLIEEIEKIGFIK